MVSIRRRILDEGSIVQEQLIRTLQDHEDRLAALEAGSSSEGGDVITYTFTSYPDKDKSTTWGTGTAETTAATQADPQAGTVEGGYAGEDYTGYGYTQDDYTYDGYTEEAYW